jgi:hypothetical protein
MAMQGRCWARRSPPRNRLAFLETGPVGTHNHRYAKVDAMGLDEAAAGVGDCGRSIRVRSLGGGEPGIREWLLLWA